jgi:alpha-beta hydrolase superfamily lysophospholipase
MNTKIEMAINGKDILRGNAWVQDKACPNLIIVTGMAETSNRYADFATYMNDNGVNVYCLDHFGQGENVEEGLSNLGVFPDSGFRKMVNAIDLLVSKLRVSFQPTIIMGHSFGSFITQDFIQRYNKHVNKVIIMGTGKKPFLSNVGYNLAKLLIHKKNRNRPSPFFHSLALGSNNRQISAPTSKNAWISRDDEVVKIYDADPLCGFTQTGGFYKEMFKGMARLYKPKFLKRIRKDMEILLISGDADPVGSYGKEVLKLAATYNKLGLQKVTTCLVSGARHEVLNEIDKKTSYKTILDFIKA